MDAAVSLVEKMMPGKKIDVFGKDSLMSSSVPYYILAAIMFYGASSVWDNAWSLIFIAYTVLPAFDEIFAYDLRNPSNEERINLEKNNFKFQLAIYVTIAVDWYFFFAAMNHVRDFEYTPSGLFNLLALAVIFSNLNSLGFMVSHQIMHKPGTFNKILATAHMGKNLYTHFTYEHIYGHHRRVGTPEDPASAQQGIDLYRFLWRSFTGSYKSVYKMEKEAGKSFFTNYSVLSVVGAIAFTLLVHSVYGGRVTAFFLFEALFSIVYLEAINYIEHYGLSRKKLANGEYEKVTIRHSWNAPHRFTNYLLFKLERHSDHHENALKPYQTLLSLDDSPHLPYGYTSMIVISFFPKVWFQIMDPLVEQYKKYAVGTIKTELTERSLSLTRRFTIKLGLFIVFMWSLTMFKHT